MKKEKLTIGFVTPEYPGKAKSSGGIGAYIRHLSLGYAEMGHEVHVIIVDANETRDYRENGVHYYEVKLNTPSWMLNEEVDDRLPLKELYLSWKAAKKLEKVERDIDFDLVETTSFRSPSLFYLLKGRRAKVFTRVSTMAQKAYEDKGRALTKKERLVCWLERMAARKSDVLATHTAAHREILADVLHISKERFHCINLGVEMKSAHQETKGKENIDVLYVGRMEPRKGADVLLEVIPPILKKYPEASFNLIGHDSNKKYQKRFVDQTNGEFNDRVRFLGKVEDDIRDEHYRQSDIFVAPSRYESFGMVYAEAMAYGKPVIGTRTGGVAELISDGENGLMAEPGDSETLSKALSQLIEDSELRRKMGENGLQSVRESFSVQKMCEKSIEWYRDSLGEKV